VLRELAIRNVCVGKTVYVSDVTLPGAVAGFHGSWSNLFE
jgi:hypothetical protein